MSEVTIEDDFGRAMSLDTAQVVVALSDAKMRRCFTVDVSGVLVGAVVWNPTRRHWYASPAGPDADGSWSGTRHGSLQEAVEALGARPDGASV